MEPALNLLAWVGVLAAPVCMAGSAWIVGRPGGGAARFPQAILFALSGASSGLAILRLVEEPAQFQFYMLALGVLWLVAFVTVQRETRRINTHTR